ncbi:DUF2889 domain-containing protein [Sessilibacter corallicola]|uniref:DUF2889 domain-containing protein n=1 Tax=Sessilibacter corallicola TaxID=2904075 RepID=UPI001E44C5CB|nr:DUF2889 domain-containing protein [Sessilibacter corallicola]MCE2030357.1 DUF2889 domain-containing protein [Sessilibacter corallicola]
MPLSKPVKRHSHHKRTINCDAFLREDNLWDIEARMIDVKAHNVDNEERGGYIPAGEAFHDISIRVTIDINFLIKHVEASIDASPFKMCNRITNAFKKLEGTRIGPGWHQQSRKLVGGVSGCTHINELLPVVATTAIQAIWPSREGDVLEGGAGIMLNTCHTWAQNSEVVEKYLPQYYRENNIIAKEQGK